MFRKVVLFDNPRDHFDIKSLAEHGCTVINLRDKLVSPFSPAFGKSVELALLDIGFDVDKDAVVMIGRQAQICMSLLSVAYTYGPFNILMYSNGDDKYVARRSTSVYQEN